MKRFGAFYDYVCSRFEGYRLSERRFNLLGDAELVKYRHVVAVQFHDITAVGGDKVHVVMDLLIYIGIIDLNALELGTEDVSDLTDGTAFFLIDEGGRGRLLDFGYRVVPGF